MGGTTTLFLRGVRTGFFLVELGSKNESTAEAKSRTLCKSVLNPDISARQILGAILVLQENEVTSSRDFDFCVWNPILTKFHKNRAVRVAWIKQYTRFDLEAQISAKESSNNVILY